MAMPSTRNPHRERQAIPVVRTISRDPAFVIHLQHHREETGDTIYGAEGFGVDDSEHYLLHDGAVYVAPKFLDPYCEIHVWNHERLQWEVTEQCYELARAIKSGEIEVKQ